MALMALCALAPTAVAHEGDPNYDSEVRAIVPAVQGLDAEVLGGDDRIELATEATASWSSRATATSRTCASCPTARCR